MYLGAKLRKVIKKNKILKKKVRRNTKKSPICALFGPFLGVFYSSFACFTCSTFSGER